MVVSDSTFASVEWKNPINFNLIQKTACEVNATSGAPPNEYQDLIMNIKIECGLGENVLNFENDIISMNVKEITMKPG